MELSQEAYTELSSLLDDEIQNNVGMGNRDRLEHLHTVQEELEELKPSK